MKLADSKYLHIVHVSTFCLNGLMLVKVAEGLQVNEAASLIIALIL